MRPITALLWAAPHTILIGAYGYQQFGKGWGTVVLVLGMVIDCLALAGHAVFSDDDDRWFDRVVDAPNFGWYWLRRHAYMLLIGLAGWWQCGGFWGLALALLGAAVDGIRWGIREASGNSDQDLLRMEALAGGAAPVGAAAPGSFLPPLPCQLESTDDEEGRRLRFAVDPVFGRGILFRAVLFPLGRDPSGAAEEPRSFHGRTLKPTQDGRLEMYVPFGEVRPPAADVPVIVLLDFMNGVDHEAPGKPVARATWSVPWPRAPYNPFVRLRPALSLALQVARADGELNAKEVRYIRKLFLPLGDVVPRAGDRLRRALKRPLPGTVEQLTQQYLFRMAGTAAPAAAIRQTLLAMLLHLAAVDGPIGLAEAAVLRRVAEAAGYTEEEWASAVAAFEIPTGRPWEVLGVSPGATRDEIRTAYRMLVARYHPDRFVNASADEQAEAHRRMIEINAAYEALNREAKN